MDNRDTERDSREYGLARVRDAYQRGADSGRPPSREDLTALFPELTQEINKFFDDGGPLAACAPVGRGRESAPEADFVERQVDGSINPETPAHGMPISESTTLPRVESSENERDQRVGTFGDYELLQRIGQGGMGLVYKARQRNPNRLVAIKMILAGRLATENDVKRFHNESAAAAHLDHPHIVPIYEVGEHDGCNYFSMRLIEGSNLEHAKAAFVADPRRAARKIATVARAIHHAHQRGVLHRDLKPSNILLDGSGTPFVVDFGVAKRLHSTLELTQGDGALGTPRYMAPEQVARDRGAVTTATDVYGLGNILYVLLTGLPAVPGISASEVLDKVLNRNPEAPGKLNRRVPRDLETICLKCLEKEPGKRYASAEELALDLERWLDGRPIKARPVGLLGRADRWCRRHPAEAILGSAAIAGTLFIIAIGGWLMVDAARKDADVERKVALEWETAIEALSAGQMTRANEAFARAIGLSSTASAAAQRHVAPRLADLRTIFRLDDIRMNHLEAPEDGLGQVRAADLYATAFRDYGIEVDLGRPTEIAAQIKKREVRGALIAALDDWAHDAADNAAKVRLLAIANAAEGQPGSLTSRVREARAAADKAALLKLVEQARSTRQRPSTLVSLATGLREQGALEQAAQLLRTAQEEQPGDFWLNLELAATLMLWHPTEPRDALPFVTAALALSGRNPGVYTYVGNVQVKAGKLADAETSYRQAIRLSEDFAVARANLGFVLNEQGKLKEAEATLARAAELDPLNPRNYYNLGINYQRQGNNERATKAYSQAIDLRPDYAEALNNYGNTLTSLGRLDGAEAAFEKALACRPRYARAYYNRGYLFDLTRRFDLAIASYKKAIECQPDYAEPHYQIAHDLVYQEGRFLEALTELDQGVKLVLPNDPTRPRWGNLQAECRRLIKLDSRLSDYLKGELKPKDAAESCDLALLCAWQSRQLFGEATRLYEQAFAIEPARASDLRLGYRYHAAGCAARAASGLGRDARIAAERTHCRDNAMEWLQADLAIRSQQIRQGKPDQAKDARAKLRYWQSDPDLAGVRDDQALQGMTDTDREKWRALWRTIAELVDKPAGPPAIQSTG
jgi:eukaryotic-like serine/threonine-protein kinase